MFQAHERPRDMQSSETTSWAGIEPGDEAILLEVLDDAIAITHADFGNIQLVDAQTGDLRIVVQRGFPQWWLDYWNSVSEGHGACGTALEHGRRVIVDDVEQSPIFIGTPGLDIQRKAGVRAVQSTPLVSRRGHKIGMLSTHFRVPFRAGSNDGRLLDLLARHATDVIERSRFETARRRSEERFRAFFDNVIFGAAQIDRSGHFIHVNDRFCDITGFSQADLIGRMGPLDLDHPEDVADDRARIAAFFTDPASCYDREKRYVRKDGRIIWVRVRVSAIRDLDGSIESTAAIIEDITGRNEAEKKLRQLGALVDTSPQFIGICGLDLKASYINPAGLRLIGLQSGEQAVGLSIFEIIHPDDRDHYSTTTFPSLIREGSAEVEVRFRHFMTGDPIWMLHTVTALKDETGEVTGYTTVSINITDRKTAEEALSKQRRPYQTVTDNATTALFILDEHQHCVFMNAAAERLTGYSLEETQGRTLHDVVHHTRPDGRPYALSDCPIDQAFPKNDREQGEEVFVHRDGHFYPVAFTASPIRDSNGNSIGTVIEVQDISERKRNEDDLKRARNLLEESQKIAHLGCFEYIASNSQTVWSDEEFGIYGLEPNGPSPSYDTLNSAFIPTIRKICTIVSRRHCRMGPSMSWNTGLSARPVRYAGYMIGRGLTTIGMANLFGTSAQRSILRSASYPRSHSGRANNVCGSPYRPGIWPFGTGISKPAKCSGTTSITRCWAMLRDR